MKYQSEINKNIKNGGAGPGQGPSGPGAGAGPGLADGATGPLVFDYFLIFI